MNKYLNKIVNQNTKITNFNKNQNKNTTKIKILLKNKKDLIINKKILENLNFLNDPYIKHILLYKKILKDNEFLNQKFINYIININLKREDKKLINYGIYKKINKKLKLF